MINNGSPNRNCVPIPNASPNANNRSPGAYSVENLNNAIEDRLLIRIGKQIAKLNRTYRIELAHSEKNMGTGNRGATGQSKEANVSVCPTNESPRLKRGRAAGKSHSPSCTTNAKTPRERKYQTKHSTNRPARKNLLMRIESPTLPQIGLSLRTKAAPQACRRV